MTTAVLAVLAGIAGAVGVADISSADTPPSVITGGQTIASGQELESNDGHYALAMLPGGNLVEQETSGANNVVWQSGTSGNPGAQAVLETDGSLVVQTAGGTLVWSNNVTTSGCPALNVQDDGNVVDYGPPGGAAPWATGTISSMNDGDLLEPGQVIDSPSHNFQLVMDADGNLVLQDNEGNALWETYTNTSPGAYASLGSDGNLAVIYQGSEIWSLSNGQAGDHLDVQDDGNMVLYPAGDNASTGGAIWSTDSAGAAVEGGNLFDTPTYGSTGPCPAPASSTPAPASTVTVTTPATTPTPTVVTVGSTTPVGGGKGTGRTKLPDLNLPIEYHWSASSGAYSYLREITFKKLPAGLHWTASITTPAKKSAAGKVITKAKTISYRAPTVKLRHTLLLWLEHRRYSVGQKVAVTLTRARYTPEVVTFTVRLHRTPAYTITGVSVQKKTATKRK